MHNDSDSSITTYAAPQNTVNCLSQYISETYYYPLLSAEEELRLSRLAANGDQSAKEILINSNLRLVLSIAKKYTGHGIPIEDLIQFGNIGLLNAANHFDSEKGFRFSTYAVFWIRQAIMRGIETTAQTIRVPGHLLEQHHKIRKEAQAFLQKTGREAEYHELDSSAGISLEDLHIINNITQIISLEKTLGDDTKTTLSDTISASPDNDTDPVDIVSQQLTHDKLVSAMSTLSDKEKTVIRLRYGLDDHDPMTLKEIGRILGVTRERVRQIEVRSLNKLAALPERYGLKDLLSTCN